MSEGSRAAGIARVGAELVLRVLAVATSLGLAGLALDAVGSPPLDPPYRPWYQFGALALGGWAIVAWVTEWASTAIGVPEDNEPTRLRCVVVRGGRELLALVGAAVVFFGFGGILGSAGSIRLPLVAWVLVGVPASWGVGRRPGGGLLEVVGLLGLAVSRSGLVMVASILPGLSPELGVVLGWTLLEGSVLAQRRDLPQALASAAWMAWLVLHLFGP